MTIKHIFFAALTAVLAASCANDDSANGSDNGQNEGKVKVTLTASTPETRVGMTKTSNSAASLYWQSGDNILVQTITGSSYGSTKMTTADDTETGSKSATFTGEVETGTELGTYAVYPYNEKHNFTSATALTYNLPSTYTYSTVESQIFSKTADGTTTYPSNNTNLPMLGTISENKVTFKMLGGMAVIRIDSMSATSGTITVTADQQLSGNFSITDLSATDASIATPSTTTSTNNSVTFTFSGATADSAGVFYLPLATGTYTDLKIVLASDSITRTLNYGSLTIGRCDVKAINFTAPDYSGVELGDIMLSDGTLVKANSITDNQKTQAIGVVAYLYGDTDVRSSKAGTHGLVMALKQPGGTSIQWRTSETAFGATCTTLKDAYENGTNGLVLTDNVINSVSDISAFPIFNAIKTFRTTVPAPKKYTTDWYIPSMGEWIDILSTSGIGGVDVSSVKSDATERETNQPLKIGNSDFATKARNNINNCLKVVGSSYYTQLEGCPYWTSTERANVSAYGIYFGDALYFNIYSKTATDANRRVRSILAF